MKTSLKINGLYLFTLLLVALTSCQKETVDISTDPAGENLLYRSMEGNDEIRGAEKEFSIYSIVEVRIERSERDDAKDQDMEVLARQRTNDRDVIVQITGKGGGWSEVFGRTNTQFQLAVSLKDYFARGEVLYTLEDDTKMQFVLSGNQKPTEIPMYDGPHTALILDTEMVNGQLNTKMVIAKACLLDAEKLLSLKSNTFSAKLYLEGSMMALK